MNLDQLLALFGGELKNMLASMFPGAAEVKLSTKDLGLAFVAAAVSFAANLGASQEELQKILDQKLASESRPKIIV